MQYDENTMASHCYLAVASVVLKKENEIFNLYR